MTVTLEGRTVTQDTKDLGFQHDNLVNTFTAIVDTESEWNYKLDIHMVVNDCFNSIMLDRTGNICTVQLTRDMLPEEGRYIMELRGYNGDKVYHSEKFYGWVYDTLEYKCTCGCE